MRINTINPCSQSKFNNGYSSPIKFTPKANVKNADTNFNGFRLNPQLDEDLLCVIGIFAIAAIPAIILTAVEKFFSSDKYNEHVFLSDGTYFAHSDDLLREGFNERA